MIESIQVTSGFATDLPGIGKKKIKFTKGLNVLFGPNGCGKTTILKIIAAYCNVNHLDTGWSQDRLDRTFTDGKLPHCLANVSPGKCKAMVKWDGTPTFHHDARQADAPLTWFGDKRDGLLNDMDHIGMQIGGTSAGQARIFHIHKMAEMLCVDAEKKRPKIDKAKNAFGEYIRSLTRKGPVTILLDEPDRSIDIPQQSYLWEALKKLAVEKRHQVIVASHCFFPTVMKEANIINLDEAGIWDMYTINTVVDAWRRMVEEPTTKKSTKKKTKKAEKKK